LHAAHAPTPSCAHCWASGVSSTGTEPKWYTKVCSPQDKPDHVRCVKFWVSGVPRAQAKGGVEVARNMEAQRQVQRLSISGTSSVLSVQARRPRMPRKGGNELPMRADGRTTSQHLTAEFFMQIFDQGASNMLFA
jgi:hypothetical protein